MSDPPELEPPGLKLGAFFFGGVEMDDAGGGPPAPMDRRFSNEQCWRATLDYVNSAKEAERLGYDSFWTTEHHFQYEGYEVIPNGLLLSAWIAAQTSRLRLGAMFNVVPQWNPLRLAEDFATVHNLSGGRAILGVGRGTVPREVLHLNDKGVSIGSFDNPDQHDADTHNREVFEESMEIVRRALTEESFSFSGKHFQIPIPGIPDRGATVQEITLVPRPLHPFEIWQAVTSPPTLDYVPVVDHGAVFWNQHYAFIKRFWDTYGERHAAAHPDRRLADHEKRMLVVSVRIEDTREEAMRTARNGHDEFWKFLGPYGWSRGYMGDDGKPARPGLIPTLEESIENKTILVGSPEDVAEEVQFYRDLLGLEHLTIFPHLLGDPYKKANEQMARFVEEVVPLLR
jgi:alkanesulfonate monooxygenase SsuD/methylene tetrahydromethanopterin reductase-like flavin-dependent oxidoreductase (luciferase family)